MEFKVLLEQFEGPLDLMIHLIQKNKLDLFDLDLDVLADQYCCFIRQAQEQGLETASEYLVEFASLLEYKSRKLLPKKEAELDENYEEDQRDRLMARLIEYQRYKEASEQLEKFLESRQQKIDRAPSSLIEEWSVPRETESMIHVPLSDLVRAMKRVMNRHAILNPLDTSMEIREISIEERMEQIEKRLPEMKNPSRFEEFLSDASSLHEVIVTFLAILELIHIQKLSFRIEYEDSERKTESVNSLNIENGKAEQQNESSIETDPETTDDLKDSEREIIWLYQI